MARPADARPHCGSVCGQTSVVAKIVGDDHIAGHQCRGKAAFDPGNKGIPVDRPVRKGRSGGLHVRRGQFRSEGAHCQVRLVSASHSPALPASTGQRRPPIFPQARTRTLPLANPHCSRDRNPKPPRRSSSKALATRDLISIDIGNIMLLPIIWWNVAHQTVPSGRHIPGQAGADRI